MIAARKIREFRDLSIVGFYACAASAGQLLIWSVLIMVMITDGYIGVVLALVP